MAARLLPDAWPVAPTAKLRHRCLRFAIAATASATATTATAAATAAAATVSVQCTLHT